MIDLEKNDLQNIPDEADPLVLLRRHREEIAQRYPTIDALCDYYKQFHSVEDARARVRAKIAETKRNAQS